MSSSDDEVLVWGPGFGSECGEQTSGLEAGPTAPRGPGPDPGPEPGAPQSGEGEGGDGFPDPEGFESEREVLEAGGPVLLGCEGRPGSPADNTAYAVQLSDESVAAILRQLADLDLLGIRRHMSPESHGVGDVSPLRDVEARPGSRRGRPENLPFLRTGNLGHSPGSGHLPPISGIPLLGRSQKYALVPWGAKESKHTGAGKKSVARRARELVAATAVSGEDNDPNRDPVPKGQLATDRPWPSCPRVHHGEPSTANLSIRGGQDSGNSKPVAMNKGEVMPRGPGPSGDQKPADHHPRLKRQQQPPRRQGCPRCLVLQKEIDDLKEQLASMQYLAEKFRIL
ncbi:uncharacterized protein CXorf49 homolog [Bos javanicus]|uniref:uncharacterized protein CXorf49 homolog n=1 Tax=Bos javanicus TaxID=9906 RepID=UPI002AA66E4F|nr:uncharacterized protein CXorf49 homolog [Bos javanicus]